MKVLWHTSIFDNLLSIPNCRGEPLSAPGAIYFCTSHYSVSWKQKICHHFIPKYPSRVMYGSNSLCFPSDSPSRPHQWALPFRMRLGWVIYFLICFHSLGISLLAAPAAAWGTGSQPQHPGTAPRHRENLSHWCLHHHHLSWTPAAFPALPVLTCCNSTV